MAEPDRNPPQESRSRRWKTLSHWLCSARVKTSAGMKALSHWLCSARVKTSAGVKTLSHWLCSARVKTSAGVIVLLFCFVLLLFWSQLQQVWYKIFPTFGYIYVDTPQVYTRERLVNDRFRQQAWLSSQLERTDELLKEGAFASVEGQITARDMRTILLSGTLNEKGQDYNVPRKLDR